MSTAVLISGQMRTFNRCYASQRWQVFRHFEPDIHFFVSCVNDENAESAKLLKQHYKNVHIETYDDPADLPEIEELYGRHAPYANAATHHQLMLQHWGNKRVWRFFRDNRPPYSSFETIIRIRPDQFFHRCTVPGKPSANQCFCAWWGSFGGINDRFAIMGSKAAEAYFTVYDKIPQLLAMGCPFHPESLVNAALDLAGVEVRPTLMTSFSTMRANGEQRWPEITSEDIAELIYAGK